MVWSCKNSSPLKISARVIKIKLERIQKAKKNDKKCISNLDDIIIKKKHVSKVWILKDNNQTNKNKKNIFFFAFSC